MITDSNKLAASPRYGFFIAFVAVCVDDLSNRVSKHIGRTRAFQHFQRFDAGFNGFEIRHPLRFDADVVPTPEYVSEVLSTFGDPSSSTE